MNSFAIGAVSLAAMVGAAGIGLFAYTRLSDQHRGPATQRTVELGVGLVITVTSLVLSLLIYSTKENFDRTEINVRDYAASIILLDRALRAYGPEALPERALLQRYTAQAIRSTWPEEFAPPAQGQPPAPVQVESRVFGEELFQLHDMIRRLQPADTDRREIAGECRTLVADMEKRRFILTEQIRRSIPPMLLGGVIAWLAMIFFSFGLSAPRNPVALLTLAACALAIASCIALVDEMDRSIDGLIKISSEPMREALAHLLP